MEMPVLDVWNANIDYIGFVLVISGIFAWIEFLKFRRLRKMLPLVKESGHAAFRMGAIPAVAYALTLLLVLGGFFAVGQAGQSAAERNRQLVQGIAPTFAYELQKMGHESVRIATKADDPHYIEMVRMVRKWMDINPDIQRIYTLRRLPDGNEVYVIAPDSSYDSFGQHTTSNAFDPIGEVYERHTDELQEAFAGQETFLQKPYEDKGAGLNLISAYVPLYDAFGRPDAVLGIDFDATKWEASIASARRNVMAIIVLLFIPIQATYWVLSRTRQERYQLDLHRKQLEESEDRFRKLSDASFEGILIARDTQVLDVNQAFAEMFGYQAEEIMALPLAELAVADSAAQLEAMLCTEDDASHELFGRRKDGTTFALEMISTPCRYRGEPARVVAVRDITERKRTEEIINHMAYHDMLTGLPNRVLFNERLVGRLQQAKASGGMLAIMFLDLDRFKLVNDTLGHSMGDKLLKGVTARILDCLRPDDIVARMGGDEFTVLMSVAHQAEAAALSEAIIESLRKPLLIDSYELHTTTSIGISLYPQDGEDAQVLMKNADTAMYRAKDQGRNSYQFYAPAMNMQGIERLELENGLRNALERDELVVHYQPRVSLDTGRIVGMEALVRWQHPTLGLVPPGKFIPLAEETGLIVPIGEWVLETACRQSKRWQEAGYPLRIAVNLSARQFQSPGLVERIHAILQATTLEPRFLELEITESITMQDVDFTITTLRQLSEMGIHISVDDFGTGYSSLSYLKHFPIHTLKIDQSFVREIGRDVYNEAIVTTVIYLAQNLRLKVVAEGVETQEQLAYLNQHRCDEMQGYLFSRPVPADAFEKLLAENSQGH